MGRGIFTGGNVLGSLGADPAEGADPGETHWVMDWESGEEATPVSYGPAGTMISAVQSLSPVASSADVGAGLLSPAAGIVGQLFNALPGLTLGQVLRAQSLIPGVPNYVVGGGVAVGGGYLLWRLFGKKKGKRGKA